MVLQTSLPDPTGATNAGFRASPVMRGPKFCICLCLFILKIQTTTKVGVEMIRSDHGHAGNHAGNAVVARKEHDGCLYVKKIRSGHGHAGTCNFISIHLESRPAWCYMTLQTSLPDPITSLTHGLEFRS